MPTPGDYSFHIARELGAVVVTVRGYLDLARSIRLGVVLGDLIDGQGNLTVGVDLRDVASFDPAGLGVFAVAAKLAGHHGGELTLTPSSGHSSRPLEATGAAAVHADQHLVEFYESDELLAESVGHYIEPGLRKDDAVLVVATKQHRELFEAAVVRAGVNVEAARAEGRYVDVDAAETLSLFMVDGTPDPVRFEAAFGGLVARLASSGRAVRIYGEMVAVLWAEGNISAALALEDLWNVLGRSQRFSLLCAYPLSAFDTVETTGSFRMVCGQHSPDLPNGAG